MMRQATETSADHLLDDSLAYDPDRIAQARAKAAEEPPRTDDPEVLMAFYAERGRAATLAGRTRQARADLGIAVKYGEQAKSSELAPILFALGNLEASMRRHVAASRLVRRAIEHNPPQVRPRLIGYNARLAGLLANTGDIEGAEKAMAEAASVAQQFMRGRGGMSPQIRAQVSRLEAAKGLLAMTRGRYADAEEIARKALADAREQQLPQQVVSLTRHSLVHALRHQGRYGEAENEARLALSEAQRERGASGSPVVSALSILSSVLADQGRYREAESLARKSVEVILASGLSASGSIRSTIAAILAGQERWEEAAKEIEALREFYGADSEEFAVESARSPHIALIDLMTGQSARALEEFGRQVEARRAHLGDKHFATAEARGLFGVALARSGRVAEARQQFELAIPILTSRSREADDQDSSATARDQRLRMIIESYMGIHVDGRDPNAAAQTFLLAEAARGRSVVRALAESAARAAASDPALADLARREQDAQRQIGALNGLLGNAISARSEEQSPSAIAQLRQRIDALRDDRARAMEEIERRFPDYANLVNPKPAAIDEARKGLRAGEALLATYSADDRTYVWAVPHQGAVGFVAAKMGRVALDAAVLNLRKALDPQAETLDDVPAFDLAAAHGLYAELLKPTESAWSHAKSLFVVPHGPLGQISLGLLPTAPVTAERDGGEPFAEYRRVPWLVRKVAVVQLPSVSSLPTLRALPAGRADRAAFVGFGDPWFSKAQADEARAASQIAMRGGKIRLRSVPKYGSELEAQLSQLPRLPETAAEVRNIAQALKSDLARDVLIGADANKGRILRTDLSGYRVVMFATHGLVPGDLVGLAQPALALTGAEVSAEGGNGLLTMEEILGLKLDADWVVLSACNTASGQGAGAEAISGLGRAFFYAGTRALLVSNWPVETTSAQKLTTDLFARQAADPALARGEALRQAMLSLIDGPGLADAAGKPVFSYAHPIFWAAFTLVGDGGGGR